jgi:hypothetical protein
LVTAALPVFERVRVRLAEAPMAMLPKLRAEGARRRCDWTPMPVRGAVMGRVESEVEMPTVPVRVPGAEGVKVTWMVQLVARGSALPVVGQVPAVVKSPVEVMPLKVAGAALVLVIWRGRVLALPSGTVPKSRAMGARVSGDGVAAPRRLMKSSAVLASEVISRALIRVVVGEDMRWAGGWPPAAG